MSSSFITPKEKLDLSEKTTSSGLFSLASNLISPVRSSSPVSTFSAGAYDPNLFVKLSVYESDISLSILIVY